MHEAEHSPQSEQLSPYRLSYMKSELYVPARHGVVATALEQARGGGAAAGHDGWRRKPAMSATTTLPPFPVPLPSGVMHVTADRETHLHHSQAERIHSRSPWLATLCASHRCPH